MIEQKLDRIIELLEIIAEAQPKSRVSRSQISDAKSIIIAHREQLRGKRITFGEFCEIIGVENSKQNRLKFGAAMTEAGVKQYRTKNARYYLFA